MTSYAVYVTPEVLDAAKRLPGKIRQRVKRAIDELEKNPRPPESKELAVPEGAPPVARQFEARRLRLDKWRIIYTVSEAEKAVDVLAIRKRPPYNYGDLDDILPNSGEIE